MFNVQRAIFQLYSGRGMIYEWGGRFRTSNISMGMVVSLFIKKNYVRYSETTYAVNHSIKLL